MTARPLPSPQDLLPESQAGGVELYRRIKIRHPYGNMVEASTADRCIFTLHSGSIAEAVIGGQSFRSRLMCDRLGPVDIDELRRRLQKGKKGGSYFAVLTEEQSMPTKLSIPTEDEIRARAYQIYLARNGEHGHAADDWLQAEYELMHLPLHKVAQLDGAAIEKQTTRHLRLIDLAHAVSMFKKPSSRQIHSLWSRPAISSTAVAT